MRPAAVCDASAVVAALLDGGPDGAWAAGRLSGRRLLAPYLMPFEVTNILRRQELSGAVDGGQAAQAHADLLDLDVELWSYAPLADGVRAARGDLTAYDASYVALATLVGAPLVTLDARLARAPGVSCAVEVP